MRSSITALLGLLLVSSSAGVVVDSYPLHTWDIDSESDGSLIWSSSDNWTDGSVPATDGSAVAVFPGKFGDDFDMDEISIEVVTDIDLRAIRFDEQSFYSFDSFSESSTLRLREAISIESGEYDGEVYFGTGITFIADGAGIIVDVGYGGEIEIAGNFLLGAEAQLQITGGGVFLLSGINSPGSMGGSIFVEEGYLGLGQNTSAGGSTIHLGDAENPGSGNVGLVAVDGDRNIINSIYVHGHFETQEDYDDKNELNLEGMVTFTSDTDLYNYGGLLNFFGGVAETSTGTTLDIWADEPVIFSSANGLTGGINVQDGVVLIADYSALPDVSPGSFFSSANEDTYIGLMIEDSTNRDPAMSEFLGLFDRTKFTGTIGFDTDPGSSGGPNSYAADIDLTGFTNGRIGSVTQAEITGTIVPSGANYQFGSGGGVLQVGSLLEDPQPASTSTNTPGLIVAAVTEPTSRGIDAESTADDPLTVFINNSANSFTGTVTATHSAVIFGNVPGALPTSATLKPQEGGYIGLQDTTRSIASFLAQFDPTIDRGIIGFDSQDPHTNRLISDVIDLTAFSATDPAFYLGTATNVTLSGNIVLPGNATDYRFAGYKGGSLIINSVLANGENDLGVVIGDQNAVATFGHEFAGTQEAVTSSVRLEGANTYSGGTRIEAGELIITNNASLGTGPVTVDGESGGFTDAVMFGYHLSGSDDFDFRSPRLSPDASDLTIANAFQIDSFLEIDVQIALTDENLTLSGDISGNGGIDKNGNGTLNLNGDNSGFDGGLYISEGTVNINTDSAAGSGPVGFGGGGSGSGQNLNFTTMSPVIGGLYEVDNNGDDYYSYSNANVQLASGSTLTIDVENNFFLDFGGSITGDGAVRLEGQGVQSLSGYNSFTGGLEIAAGANLVASDTGSLGGSYPDPPAVTLDGGFLTLNLDDESTIEADISFGPNGGEIRGNGSLNVGDGLTIGAGAGISPGRSIGKIEFEGALNLGELGSLTVEIGDGNNDEVISDIVFADNINITASSASPFSIYLLGEDGDLPTNFDAKQAYSWSVLLSGATLTNFDAQVFDLSISSSLASITADGIWAVQLGSSGDSFGETFLTNNTVMVSFTPVPEPSTFALVGLGLILVTFRAGRRRRPAA